MAALTLTRRRRAAPDSWSLRWAFRKAKVQAIFEGFLRWLYRDRFLPPRKMKQVASDRKYLVVRPG